MSKRDWQNKYSRESQLFYSKKSSQEERLGLLQVLNIRINVLVDSETSSKSETKIYQVGLWLKAITKISIYYIKTIFTFIMPELWQPENSVLRSKLELKMLKIAVHLSSYFLTISDCKVFRKIFVYHDVKSFG